MYPVSSGTATVDSRAKLSGRAASRGDRTPWALLGVSPSARLRDARAAFSRGRGPAGACRPRSPGAPRFPLVRGCPPAWKRSARAKGARGGAPPAGRAEAGPLGALSAPPGKRGASVSGGSSPLPFPQSPSLRGCLPAPSPPAAEASIPSARVRTRRCRRFQSRLLIIDTDIIFSPMNKDLAVAIRTALPRPNAAL